MLIVPALLDTISTLKDGTIKLVFETQELAPAQVGTLFSYRKGIGFLAFKPETFDEDQVALIESLKVEEFENKSPSKRQRDILFRLWQQDNKGYTDFNLFYQYRMNNLCEMLKNEFL